MDDDDPTKVTNQPSLTTSTGRIWLILGGIMAAIAVVLLWSLQQVNSTGVAIVGIVVILLLYVAMVEVRLLVRGGRLRLALMAVCFGGIAAVALVCVLVIGMSQIPS
jgi:Flp pilus assembly protein TadB